MSQFSQSNVTSVIWSPGGDPSTTVRTEASQSRTPYSWAYLGCAIIIVIITTYCVVNQSYLRLRKKLCPGWGIEPSDQEVPSRNKPVQIVQHPPSYISAEPPPYTESNFEVLDTYTKGKSHKPSNMRKEWSNEIEEVDVLRLSPAPRYNDVFQLPGATQYSSHQQTQPNTVVTDTPSSHPQCLTTFDHCVCVTVVHEGDLSSGESISLGGSDASCVDLPPSYSEQHSPESHV